jgi:hypothetical protein
MDEMAIGLSWFVLYTMTHSAVQKHLWKPRASAPAASPPTAVRFEAHQALQVQNDTHKICRGESVILELSAESPEALAIGMEDFFRLQPSRDTRMLLRHVEKLNTPNLQTRYYKNFKISTSASRLRRVARFVYHRNGIPPTAWLKDPMAGWEDDAPTNIEMRNNEVVEHFFRTLLREFLDDLKLDGEPLHNDNVKAWHNAACEQTLKAAQAHFANVHQICKVYSHIWPMVCADMVCADIDVTATLKHLQQKLSSLDSDNPTEVSQFVVLALWTRFGPRVDVASGHAAGHEQEWEGGARVSSKKTNKQTHLAAAKVQRYSLLLETTAESKKKRLEELKRKRLGLEEKPSFVKLSAKFLTDPIGITHLDVINRGLDLSAQVLRKILMETACMYAAEGKNENVMKQLISLSLPEFAVMKPQEVFSGSSAFLYSEYWPEGGGAKSLADEFFDRHVSVPAMEEKFSNFVRMDPHFCDPRFLARFFADIKDDTGKKQLIEEASKLVDVCDHSAHQFNLLNPKAYTYSKLQNDLSNILGCIRNIRELLHIRAEVAESEHKALQEMQSMLPNYFLWRRRQHAAVHIRSAAEGGPGINKVAKDTVAALLERLERGEGTLSALDENDNSQVVLVELLRLLGPDARHVAGGEAAAPAAAADRVVAVSNKNPFAALEIYPFDEGDEASLTNDSDDE